MSSTTTPTSTSTSAAASSTSGCGNNLYEIPASDAACAMPYGGNHTTLMADCCGSADVVSYDDDCGLYCLAVDQSVDDITACLYKNGAPWADVFCNDDGNATATATDAPLSSGASVIAATGASGTKSAGASSTGSSNSTSAAPGSAPGGIGLGLTKVSVSALLLSSVLFGALQL